MLILINMQLEAIWYLYFAKKDETRKFIMHVCNFAAIYEYTNTMYTCRHFVENVYLAWKMYMSSKFFIYGGKNLKQSLNDALKNPLPHSINIIYIYTINFLNILNLISVYLSEVFTHCLLKENIHFKTLGCCYYFTSWKFEIKNDFIQIIATWEQDKTALVIFKSLQNIFSEVQTLSRHENVYLSKMST